MAARVDFTRIQAPLQEALHADVVSVWQTQTIVTAHGDRVQGDPVMIQAALPCDAQDYSNVLAEEEYGLKVDAQYRLYTTGSLALTNLVLWRGQYYKVTALPETGAVTVALITPWEAKKVD